MLRREKPYKLWETLSIKNVFGILVISANVINKDNSLFVWKTLNPVQRDWLKEPRLHWLHIQTIIIIIIHVGLPVFPFTWKAFKLFPISSYGELLLWSKSGLTQQTLLQNLLGEQSD